MARNGSGVFAVLNPIMVGAVRSSTAVNEDFTDMGTAITGSLPIDAEAAMSGQFKAASGSKTSPAISFVNDQNTGFRRIAADEVAWVNGGNDRFYIDSAGKAWHLGNADVAGAFVINGDYTGSNDTAAIEALSTTGLARRTADNTWQIDDGTHPISFTFQGNSTVLGAGLRFDLMVPYPCILSGVTLLADQTGSAVVDIWKASYSNYPPTSANSVTSATPPTLTSATTYSDTALSGWTTTIAANDCLRLNLTSCTSITRLAVTLKAKRYQP